MPKTISTTIEPEQIPEIQQKIIYLLNKQVDTFIAQASMLTADDLKSVLSIREALTSLYKDYRLEVLTIEKDLRARPQAELLELIKAETPRK